MVKGQFDSNFKHMTIENDIIGMLGSLVDIILSLDWKAFTASWHSNGNKFHHLLADIVLYSYELEIEFIQALLSTV